MDNISLAILECGEDIVAENIAALANLQGTSIREIIQLVNDGILEII